MTWLSFITTEISSSCFSTLLQESLLCCNILSVLILNLCRDRLFFVETEFLPIVWICCHDRLFLCRNRVVLPCIAETELFVATLNPLSRQTCLCSSHFFSIFCCNIKLLCRDRNLLLSKFYCRDIIFLCRDRDFCLQFFILSQNEFLCRNILFVIFSTSIATIFVFVVTKFTLASCCVCRDKIFLFPIPGSECYVATWFSSVAT